MSHKTILMCARGKGHDEKEVEEVATVNRDFLKQQLYSVQTTPPPVVSAFMAACLPCWGACRTLLGQMSGARGRASAQTQGRTVCPEIPSCKHAT